MDKPSLARFSFTMSFGGYPELKHVSDWSSPHHIVLLTVCANITGLTMPRRGQSMCTSIWGLLHQFIISRSLQLISSSSASDGALVGPHYWPILSSIDTTVRRSGHVRVVSKFSSSSASSSKIYHLDFRSIMHV